MNNDFSPAAPPADSRYQDLDNSQAKDHLLAILLSIFLGPLGVDRFYLGYVTSGIIKLLMNCFLFVFVVVGIIVGVIATSIDDVDEVSIQIDDAAVAALIVLFIVVVLAVFLISLIWEIADIVRISTKSLQPKNGGYKN